MIHTEDFFTYLSQYGFQFYTGVPCSFLSPLINEALNNNSYIAAANEGDALATAAGVALGKKKAVVLMQNSGLGNAVSPLSSLTYTFKLPVLGFVSLRGDAGLQDEPQHELMGNITTHLLDTLAIPWAYLSDDNHKIKSQLDMANQYIEKGRTFFFIVKKNTLSPVTLQPHSMHKPSWQPAQIMDDALEKPSRYHALSTIHHCRDEQSIIITTTGKTGRELYCINDHALNVYMVGSMGCVTPLALGLALAQPSKKIMAIDGDGALLMRLGAMATNAQYAPPNLCHILLDNQAHDSTGGQATVSSHVQFAMIAAYCAYPMSCQVSSLLDLETGIKHWLKQPLLSFISLPIQAGSISPLGRPKIAPHVLKQRLQEQLS